MCIQMKVVTPGNTDVTREGTPCFLGAGGPCGVPSRLATGKRPRAAGVCAMLARMRRTGLRLALLLLVTPVVARAGDTPDPAAARAWLATIRPSADLQRFLDRTVD